MSVCTCHIQVSRRVRGGGAAAVAGERGLGFSMYINGMGLIMDGVGDRVGDRSKISLHI